MEFKKILDLKEDSYYIYDEDRLVRNFNEFLNAFKKYYNNVEIAYSYKTNYLPKLCSKIEELGGIAEVVSEMELDLALRIAKRKKIIFNGPHKNKDSIIKAIENGVIIHIDNIDELVVINDFLKHRKDLRCNVGIRINLSIDQKKPSRFGINPSEIENILKSIDSNDRINLEGIHCHLPNRELNSFKFRCKEILKSYDKFFKNKINYIDIGGGFPSKLQKPLSEKLNIEDINISEYAKKIGVIFNDYFKKNPHDKLPKLILEPGTAIVANTLSFYSKIISEKKIGNKIILTSTGSMYNFKGPNNTNLNFPFEEIIDLRTSNRKSRLCDVSGYTCIENDYLLKDVNLKLRKGDFLRIEDIGSYSIVMKPPFISPNVPIFMITEDNIIEVKRRETPNDIFNTFLFDD